MAPRSPSFLKWMAGLADTSFLEPHSLVLVDNHPTTTKARVCSFQAESRTILDCRRLFGSYSLPARASAGADAGAVAVAGASP